MMQSVTDLIPGTTVLSSHEWWRGGVIYQVYPRSFADANGDGVGDLQGITERLDHIASLGMEAVWLSPVFRSPMKDFGYDVSDYRDIDPMFGDLDDFDQLVERAHQLGLRVLIDQVVSHSSDQHPWFEESRSSRSNEKADWYVWADARPDGSPPNNWLSVFGGSSWQWDTRRRQYYLHNFLASQPDLNLHHPAVQGQLLDDMRFWLERGVDGFRFDTVNYYFHDPDLRDNPQRTDGVDCTNPYDMQLHIFDKNRPETVAFLARMRSLLNEFGAASVGEIGDADCLPQMVAYTADHRHLHMTYSFALLSPDKSATHLRRQGESFDRAAGGTDAWPCWTLGNHDAVRVVTRWGGEDRPADFVRASLVALSALRGTLCWYQGDELGLAQADIPFEALRDPAGIEFWPEYKGRDGCRTPMPWNKEAPNAGFSANGNATPWLPMPPGHCQRAVEAEESDPTAAIHFVRAFLKWRSTRPELRVGAARYLNAPDTVLAAVRSVVGGPFATIILVNLSSQAVNCVLPEMALSSLLTVPGLPIHQAGVANGGQTFLPPWGIYLGSLPQSLDGV